MRLLIRFVLLLLLATAVYALWPRTPHLTTFDANKVAKLETRAWQGAKAGASLDGAMALYQLYDRQYGLSPVSAVKITQNQARALNLIRTSPDAVDQEKALPYFETALGEIQFAVNRPMDAAPAAQSLFHAWALTTQSAPNQEIGAAIAQSWAGLYDKPASAFTQSANHYAEAMRASGFAPGSSADWQQVESALAQAYTQLAATLK